VDITEKQGVPHEPFMQIKRRYRIRHGKPGATMEASSEEIKLFIMFLWGEEDNLPKHVPRLSLDIWLDILLAIRNVIVEDPEKHRYTSVKSRMRNQYPDNVFSWILNQLVELGFLIKQKDSKPYIHGHGVRYFLTEQGTTLLAMFDSFVKKRKIEAENVSF
jgi:DNA-binding HxlR family transcriptional regulator